MEELAAKWQDLTDIQQASITELIAGKRQGNIISSIMQNFDIAQDALQTSLNSSGSAMKEHEKWSQSLEARLNKLKATWQSLSQSFMNSDFLKGALDGVIALVDALDKLINTFGTLGTIGIGTSIFSLFKLKGTGIKSGILGDLSTFGSLASEVMHSSDKLGVKFKNLGAAASEAGGSIAGRLTGSFAGIATGVGIAVAAIGLIVNLYKKYKEEQAEIRRETIETSNSFLDSASSFEQAYIKYSGKTSLTSEEEADLESAIQGTVDALGDKSSALQNVVNSSNDYLSSLKQIADEEIKEAARAAKAKRDAAEKDLKEAAIGWSEIDGSEVDIKISTGIDPSSSEEAKIAKQIGEKYYTALSTSREGTTATMGFRLPANANTDEILDYYYTLVKYQEALSDADLGDTKAYDNVTAAIDKMSEAVGTYTDGVYDAAKAQYQLENGIPTTVEEYLKMRESILNEIGGSIETRKTIAGTLDSEYGSAFDLTTVEAQARKLVGVLDKYGDKEVGKMELFLNMRTAVNNGECTVGEYISQFDNINDMIKDWDDESKEEFNLAFGIDTDTVKQQYDELVDYVSKFVGDAKAKNFLDGLTVNELSATIRLKEEIDWDKTSISKIKKQIEKEAEFIEAMNFTIGIDVEAENVEALNTALSESVSATGLSSESIETLKSRYAELASQGYDLSAMFEETSNGIHLNRNAVDELEQAYASQKLSEADNNLKVLKDRYDELTTQIQNCTDAEERASLYQEQQSVAQKINDLATLSAQYEGLTSAYNAWQNAESAGQERDMYESIIEGFENVGDEISRGWTDDGTIKFLELLTGRTDLASKSGKELKEVYNGLDETINSAGYSIRDFFTVNDDGDSTNTGVYNFLRTVEAQYKDVEDVIKKNENGEIIGFNFDVVGGDEAVAKALGISEELVQIMTRAADDAGFVVTIDGNYTQLADLKNYAEEANDTLKKLGKTDVDFNFDASSLEDLNTELGKAMDVLDQFRNKDGTINMEMEGAEEALDIASYFTATIDKLSEPVYMQLETNQVEENLQEPLKKMQEFEDLSKKKHQLQLTGDGEKLKETEEQMSAIAEDLKNLDKDTKIELGIDGLNTDEIKDKLEKGEIEIPATVDIQLEMSEDIKDMRLLMMNQIGLVSDEEVKLKIGYEIDDSAIDKLTDEEKEVVVKFIADNEDWFNELSEDKKEIVIDIVSSGFDLDALDEDKKKIAIDFVSDNQDWFDTLSEDEKKIAIDLAINNKDEFDNLTDEEKKVVVDLSTDDSALKALEDHQVTIEAFAKVFGVEKVDDLKTKLDGLTDEQIQVLAKVAGQIDVDKLKSTINGLDDKTVQAIAKALGEGDVSGLKSTINGLDDKTVQAIAQAFGYDNVKQLNGAIDNLDPKTVQAIAQALGINDVNSLRDAVNRLSNKNVSAVATVSGEGDVDSLRGAIDSLKGKTVTVWATIKKKASSLWDSLTGGSDVNGTANVNGTAYAQGTTGRALKRGDWGTSDSGSALVGELGKEILVRNGRYYTIGDNGAEFIKYKKGDIIFNHKIKFVVLHSDMYEKIYLIAGKLLESCKLQHKDEICLGVNVRKLQELGNQQLRPE